VFVDRTRRHQTSHVIGEIVKRLIDGTSVVLFAEGASSDGNRVLPFRSALVGAVNAVVSYGDPVAANGTADRKAMANSLEGTMRALNTATLRWRPRKAYATTS
jgi:1-acyl-sn-glycerol-3-phosphate acyltransferase